MWFPAPKQGFSQPSVIPASGIWCSPSSGFYGHCIHTYTSTLKHVAIHIIKNKSFQCKLFHHFRHRYSSSIPWHRRIHAVTPLSLKRLGVERVAYVCSCTAQGKTQAGTFECCPDRAYPSIRHKQNRKHAIARSILFQTSVAWLENCEMIYSLNSKYIIVMSTQNYIMNNWRRLGEGTYSSRVFLIGTISSYFRIFMYRMHFSDLYPLVVLRYNSVFNSTEYFIYLSLLLLRKYPKKKW